MAVSPPAKAHSSLNSEEIPSSSIGARFLKDFPMGCESELVDDSSLLSTLTNCCIIDSHVAGRKADSRLNSTDPLNTEAGSPQTHITSADHSQESFDFNVPYSLGPAIVRFIKEPSVPIILIGIGATISFRVHHPWGPADVLAMPLVALLWWLQEWFIHSKLLHNDSNWYGRRVHARHHNAPFYHVSVDSPNLVLPFMLISGCFWHLLLKGNPGLALTATMTYYITGFAYEWTHYLVHTRVPMRSWLARTIKRAHVRHHLKDERFWFSFTCPPIDDLLGTVPPPGLSLRHVSAGPTTT